MPNVTIHSEQERHPRYPLGLNPHEVPDDKLLALDWKAGQVPSYEPKIDRLSRITIGLDENDRLGDCGPTSCDNHRRIQSLFLLGTEKQAPIDKVLDLYRRSTHPPFDPATGNNDNGVQMPDLMKAMRDGGLDGDKVVAYARLSNTDDGSIMAAIDIFGAVIFAVDLQTAQQSQSDQPNPVWDYRPSGIWGGHAIVAASYDSSTGIITVGSWGMQIGTTRTFRQHQLSEVWVPIYQWIIDSDKFVSSVDATALAADFKQLTGGILPVNPTPPGPTPGPTPGPNPPGPSNGTMLTVGPFSDSQMVVINRRASKHNESPSDYVTHLATQAIKASFVDKLEALFKSGD